MHDWAASQKQINIFQISWPSSECKCSEKSSLHPNIQNPSETTHSLQWWLTRYEREISAASSWARSRVRCVSALSLTRFNLHIPSLSSLLIWGCEIKLFNYSPHLQPWSTVRFVCFTQRRRSEQPAAGGARINVPPLRPTAAFPAWLRGWREKRNHCLPPSWETDLQHPSTAGMSNWWDGAQA